MKWTNKIENQDENNIFNYSLEGFVSLVLKSKIRTVIEFHDKKGEIEILEWGLASLKDSFNFNSSSHLWCFTILGWACGKTGNLEWAYLWWGSLRAAHECQF